MYIVDIHTHVYPEKIADAAGSSIAGFYDAHLAHRGTAEDLLAAGEKAGVERFVVFSTATKAAQVPSINRFIAATCAAHPSFTGLGTIYPGYEGHEAELDFLLSQGIRGIKLHPDCQRFCADDPVMFPIYDAIARRGMFLLFHSGDYRYDYSHPRRLAAVAQRYPDMPLIAAHCGGWMQWAEAREAFAHTENVWFDTSSCLGFAGPEPLLGALASFGVSRLMFGTDFPMWDPSEERDRILRLGLTAAENEAIFHKNFERFQLLTGC